MNLSKSRYTAYCQCPKNLWYRVYHPEFAAEVDPAAQARFETGSAVGELAKRLFPGTVDVTTRNADGSLDLSAMIEKTRRLMDNSSDSHQFVPQGNSLDSQNSPLCIAEAAFTHDGCYCAVDLLRREGDGWALYEVKSTGTKGDDGKQEKFDKYLPDIAYQTWVLQQCGVNVVGVNLVCLNSDYVRHGNLDLLQLFAVVDMREAIQNELDKVPMQVPAALKVLSAEHEPEAALSEHCNKPYTCPCMECCMKEAGIPQDCQTVFDLYRMNFAHKLKHFRAGRVTLEDMRSESLSPTQRLQIECTLGDKENINADGIRRFLDGLCYPLYFLDFETMQDAVPQYDGTRPYQQVPFQYSLHIKRDAAAPYEHREYLAPSDGSDPRRALAEQLCRDIPRGVCTLAYNMSFERGRLKELADACPDLAGHLMDIHSRMQDLLVPFREGNYYVPAMNGSFSIKSVLPALFPNDPKLDSPTLAGNVKNGGEAMTIFPKIKDMSPADAADARESLLRYCELDTWAMVKVWEKLREKIE